jgi:hypothetical protein
MHALGRPGPRLLALVAVATALLLRALIPAGVMLDLDPVRGLRIAVCTGHGAPAPTPGPADGDSARPAAVHAVPHASDAAAHHPGHGHAGHAHGGDHPSGDRQTVSPIGAPVGDAVATVMVGGDTDPAATEPVSHGEQSTGSTTTCPFAATCIAALVTVRPVGAAPPPSGHRAAVTGFDAVERADEAHVRPAPRAPPAGRSAA